MNKIKSMAIFGGIMLLSLSSLNYAIAAPKAGKNPKAEKAPKIEICHNFHVITISADAYEKHADHGAEIARNNRFLPGDGIVGLEVDEDCVLID